MHKAVKNQRGGNIYTIKVRGALELDAQCLLSRDQITSDNLTDWTRSIIALFGGCKIPS